MRHKTDLGGHPLRIGHRGAAGYAPENTMASLHLAINLGVDLVEFDVRRSVDGRLVLMHDDTVDRTTNGKGRVEDLPLSVLRRLDAGGGEQIPLLEEALASLTGRAGVIIEIKVPGIASEVCRVVEALCFQGPCIYASFLHEELQKVRVIKPEASLLALVEGQPDPPLAQMRAVKASYVGLALEMVTPEVVQTFQDDGLAVFVYTVNERKDIDRMKRLGVDGIISNFPERI